MSAAILCAQSKPQDTASNPSEPAKADAGVSTAIVTFTGCLGPASKDDSYYLTSAKQKGVKGSGQNLKIVPANKKVNFEPYVTREVEVQGTLDRPAASGTASPTLTVTKVKTRADGC